MPELMRAIAGRLREFVGNRRRAPRLPTRLVAVVSIDAAKTTTRVPLNLPTVAAHTRDVSATGLSIIVPGIRIGERYLTGPDQLLRLTLKLPAGLIELRAAPVRYEQLPEDDPDTGYLIGLHIREITDRDRTLYIDHLRSLRK
ncbi:MAG TPA: PilZ domain-containing protein [Pyrinomonadaceae bacterium]|nr:PilZ domain-containing protein [Pyrinomonadaceae bacterium]